MDRDFLGAPLVPGYNVDKVDIGAGLAEAARAGYGDGLAATVVQYALQLHARGKEDQAQRAWLSEYPRDLASWYRILVAATAEGVLETIEKAQVFHALGGEL